MDKEYIWYLTDLPKVPKNGYKVFTTFSCGGGSSMGYKLAGYEVIGNCEIDPKINEMYVKNHHPKYNFLMGVQDFYKLENIPEELFDIDVLDGSPPCSTFSTAGLREKAWGKEKHFREGQAKQILDDLFFEYLNVVEVLKPKICIAENVRGLVTGNAKGYVNLVFKRFRELGYDVQLFLLNASTMGVPQKRERVFFIARRKDLNLPAIKLEFHEKPILYGEFADEDYRPFNQGTMALGRWEKRSPRDQSLGDTIKRTENGKVSQFNAAYIKKDCVPPTMLATSSVNFIRFDKPGYLSNKDLITIQTFPQDYDFNGNDVGYVCGMSVPPIMMKKVAKEVQLQLLDKIGK